MSKTMRVSLPVLSFTYVLIFLFWLVYRCSTRNIDLVDEFIAKPIIWVMPVIFISFWKNIKLSELGFKKLSLKNFFLSLVSGIFLATLQFVPIHFQFHKPISIPPNFIMMTLATIGTALSEEILFRGFIYKQLSKYFSVVLNTIITSILFALIHLPILIFIQNISGVSLLSSLYIIFISSVVFCLLYAYSKNLWVPILTHFLFDTFLLLF